MISQEWRICLHTELMKWRVHSFPDAFYLYMASSMDQADERMRMS